MAWRSGSGRRRASGLFLGHQQSQLIYQEAQATAEPNQGSFTHGLTLAGEDENGGESRTRRSDIQQTVLISTVLNQMIPQRIEQFVPRRDAIGGIDKTISESGRRP